MSASTIVLLDAAITTINSVSKTMELMLRLQQEGRDIGADELMRLTQETNARRAAWDEAYAAAKAKLDGQ